MKKRVSLCLTAVLVLLALAAPAHADIIVEPDNSFYSRHQSQCTPLQRSYYANGPDGFVTLWDAPNGINVAAQYENGEVLRVFCLYQNWGFVFLDYYSGGWVPMEQMELVYDYISFEEDYGEQFRDYAGEFVDYASQPLTRTVSISTWEYPGAPEPNGSLSTWYPSNEDMLQSPDCFEAVFTDEDSLDWGFIGNNFKYWSNCWICFDDPTATEFPVRAIPQVELVPAQTPVMQSVSYVPYILVGGVVLVTAGLLIVFYRRRRKFS